MGENTKIEWCDHTFNPWRGCTRVSEGCRNCYAEQGSKRNPKVLGIWGDNGTRIVASPATWKEPERWHAAAREVNANRQAFHRDPTIEARPRVFCASLADVCEDRADLIEPRARLRELIRQTPGLDWLLLTKRPENFRRLFWAEPWPIAVTRRQESAGWPNNVWAGTSVENQETADLRIPHLLATPAAMRFISYEPALGPVDFSAAFRMVRSSVPSEAFGVRWIIVGGESGARHKARWFNVDWARSTLAQCRAAGVACFIKQVGVNAWEGETDCPGQGRVRRKLWISHAKGGEPAEWPEDLRIREFPR